MAVVKDLIGSITSGMFLAKEPCVFVLFGMTAVDIGIIHSESGYGSYSLNKHNVDFWGWQDTPGFRESPCMLAFTYLTQIHPLQKLIENAAKKRIIALDTESQTTLNNSYVKTLQGSMDKRHHPVQIIRFKSGSTPVLIDHVIVCKDPPTEHVVNKHENGKWFLKVKFDVDSIEGYCHNGHHLLHGKRLKVSTFSVPPFVIFDASFTEATGVSVDLVEVFASHFNIELEYILAPTWAGYNEDGELEYGSVAQMVLGQSDFAIEDPIQLNLPNYPKMSTTQMLYQNNMNFLARPPMERQPEKNIAYVLDTATWALFFSSLIVVTFIFGIISQLNGENLIGSLLVPYGIVFQEFHEYNPKWKRKIRRHTTSSRLLRIFWVIVSSLVVTSFLGNLKSSFILKEYEKAVETLKDIIDLYEFECIYVRNPLHLDVKGISGAKGRKLAEMAADGQTILPDTHDFLEISFNNVVNEGGAALFFPETALYMKGAYIATGVDFPVMVVRERFAINNMGYSFPYQSPMIPLFNKAIGRVKASGIIDRLLDKHSPYRSMKQQISRTSDDDNRVRLAHIYIPLWCYLSGMVMGMFIFIVENLSGMSKVQQFNLDLD